MLVTITALLFSCEAAKLVDLEPIAIEIIDRVGGNDGSIFIVETQNLVPNQTVYYVELDVKNSELIHKFKAEKGLTASYCALELYRRIPQKWGDDYYGYNIIFDSEEDFLSRRTYFYTREELELISPALDKVNEYLFAISENRLEYAAKLIDTTFYQLDALEITASVANQIGTDVIETRQFFMPQLYTFDHKTIECLNVTTMVFKSDRSQRNIYFRVPKRTEKMRIMKVQVK